jgi:hypothetical protein
MPLPWERYQQQQPQSQQAGPWQQYQKPTREFVGPLQEREFVGPQQPPGYLSRTVAALGDYMKSLGRTATTKPWEIPRALMEQNLALGSGMLAAPVNDIINAGLEAGEFPTKDVIPTYQPRTELGRSMVQAGGEIMSPVGAAVDYATDINNPDPGVRATGRLMRAASAILPAVGMRGMPKGAPRPAPRPPPTTAELRTAADEAFARARALGKEEIIKQDSLGRFTNQAERTLGGAEYAFDPQLHPQTAISYRILMDESTKPGTAGHSPQGLEVIRRKLMTAENNAIRSGMPDDARLAGKLLDDFDEFADNLVDGRDIIGSGAGDAKASIAARTEARELWSRLKRAQTIEDLVERARISSPALTQTGLENALRLQFKQLALNKRRMRQFSAEERAAIERVATGGRLQQAARRVAGLAPRGVVSATGTTLLGNTLAGPAGSAALLGLGEAGALAARIMRLRDVEAASELVRRGRGASAETAGRPVISPVGAVRGAIRGSQVIPPANALSRERERNALKR